jgi:hypothetical protein
MRRRVGTGIFVVASVAACGRIGYSLKDETDFDGDQTPTAAGAGGAQPDGSIGPTGGASGTTGAATGSASSSSTGNSSGSTGNAGPGGAGSGAAGASATSTTAGPGGAAGAGKGGASGSGGAAASMDGGVAEAARPDSSSSACPSGISLSGQTMLPLAGTATGAPWTDVCPPGQAIIGYLGSTSGGVIEMLQTLCGQLSIAALAGSCEVQVSAGAMMPARGNATPKSPWTLQCPANQIAVGCSGQAAGRVNQLSLDCAPLVLSPSGGSYSLTVGNITQLAPMGGNNATPFHNSCPVGDVANGQLISAYNLIQGFQLFCTTPTVAP